jgi:hypothetical protein
MDHHGQFGDVPSDLGVFGLLVRGDGGKSRNLPLFLRDPQLRLIHIALKNVSVRVTGIPLEVATRSHQWNHSAQERHNRNQILDFPLSYLHHIPYLVMVAEPRAGEVNGGISPLLNSRHTYLNPGSSVHWEALVGPR